jgi:hypothetical protein
MKLVMVSVVQFPTSDEVFWLCHSILLIGLGFGAWHGWWAFSLLLHVQTTVALNCRLYVEGTQFESWRGYHLSWLRGLSWFSALRLDECHVSTTEFAVATHFQILSHSFIHSFMVHIVRTVLYLGNHDQADSSDR